MQLLRVAMPVYRGPDFLGDPAIFEIIGPIAGVGDDETCTGLWRIVGIDVALRLREESD
jgi:hypothetical protein